MPKHNVYMGKENGYSDVIHLIKGDKRTAIIRMAVKRRHSGVDLEGLAWKINVVNSVGQEDVYTPSAVVKDDDGIYVEWMPKGIATAVEGYTKYQLVGLGTDDAGEQMECWFAEKRIRVGPSFDAQISDEQEEAVSALDEMIMTVQLELPTVYAARDAANDAAAAANASAADASAAVDKANATADKANAAADKVDDIGKNLIKDIEAFGAIATEAKLTAESAAALASESLGEVYDLQIGGRNYILGTGTPAIASNDGAASKTMHLFLCKDAETADRLYGKTVVLSFDYTSNVSSGYASLNYNNTWQNIYRFHPWYTGLYLELHLQPNPIYSQVFYKTLQPISFVLLSK